MKPQYEAVGFKTNHYQRNEFKATSGDYRRIVELAEDFLKQGNCKVHIYCYSRRYSWKRFGGHSFRQFRNLRCTMESNHDGEVAVQYKG